MEIRDSACFGRAARLVWRKRRWCCTDADWEAKTWTETSPHVSVHTVLSGWRRVGGVPPGRDESPSCGRPGRRAELVLVDGEAGRHRARPAAGGRPQRSGRRQDPKVERDVVPQGKRHHATRYATGLVGLDRRMVIDMAEATPQPTCGDGVRTRSQRGWRTSPQWPPTWPSPTGPDCGRNSPTLSGWRSVPWLRVANRCVDKVRQRVQNETLGHHRGRKPDPVYRIRKLLLTGTERLGEPGSSRGAASACASAIPTTRCPVPG